MWMMYRKNSLILHVCRNAQPLVSRLILARRSYSTKPKAPLKAKNTKKAKRLEEVEVDILPIVYASPAERLSHEPPYGFLASNVPRTSGSFYITSGSTFCDEHPHMGNVCASILADTVARWQMMHGKQVMFQTGVRDRDQRQSTTSRNHLNTLQLSDHFTPHIRCAHERLKIATTQFVDIFDEDHQRVVEELWQKCRENGDIYLLDFNGWYNEYEDVFLDDVEARNLGFIDHFTANPLIRLEQPCYYFRLSKYRDSLIALLEGSSFVKPDSYRDRILARLKNYPLGDLPISRSDLDIGFKSSGDDPHVVHSWFSALARYLISGPADMHIIRENAVWYHAIVWPAFLMSAGLQNVATVWVHGGILSTDLQGRFSGNAVSPHDILDSVPADTLRWYILRAREDPLLFSTSVMKSLHDNDLRLLGNLMHRAIVLSAKYCNGCVPRALGTEPFPFSVSTVKGLIEDAFRRCDMASATDALVAATQATEDWLTGLVAGGRLSKMDNDTRQSVIRVMLEAVFVLAHLYAAFTPSTADAIVSKYSSPVLSLADLNSFNNLLPGSVVSSNSILFKPIEASSTIREDTNDREDDQCSLPGELATIALDDMNLPEGLQLYLSQEWAPGVLIRPAGEEILGDNQMVDERFEYTPLLSRIRPGEQCLDIGGHIGTLAIAMAESAPDVHVVSVEPDPDSAALLDANLRWRRLSNVALLHGALRSRASAFITLYRAPLNSSVNSCVPVQGRDAVHVPVVTVAEMLQACQSPPTIVKMDIEGGEYEALPVVLAACPELRLLSLELHFTKKVFKTHLAPALVELLEMFGFRPLQKQKPARQGAAELTFWIREASHPRVDPLLVPPLLALWRKTYDSCTENLAKRVGLDGVD